MASAGRVAWIYVVMQMRNRDVDTYFLHRQLKLDKFRQEFQRVTNASVNRRGSLRWPEFSQIEILVPEIREQRAISRVLRDAEAEVDELERRLPRGKLASGLRYRPRRDLGRIPG
jgi:type I restriction enzyme, S subunit